MLDASVAPEEGKSWELGAKLDMPGSLTGTLALFDITKRNVLVANFDSGTGETVYSNAGEVSSRGVELDLTGQLSERWSLIGSYAFTDAKVTKDLILKQTPAECGQAQRFVVGGVRLRQPVRWRQSALGGRRALRG